MLWIFFGATLFFIKAEFRSDSLLFNILSFSFTLTPAPVDIITLGPVGSLKFLLCLLNIFTLDANSPPPIIFLTFIDKFISILFTILKDKSWKSFLIGISFNLMI